MFNQFPLFVTMLFLCSAPIYANKMAEQDITKQQLLRMIDTKEEFGKSCEAYSYIPANERLKLLVHKHFMFGDILRDSLSIPPVNPDHLVDTNLTECNLNTVYISEYIYREKLGYLNEHSITIEILRYVYGAFAAHGNGRIFHYVYERDYGMKLIWKELFGENASFEHYILERVRNEIVNIDYVTYFKSSAEVFNYKKVGYFGITNEGLIIQYGKYEITPGADGLPSLVVPKEVLRQYMSKENYTRYFTSEEWEKN